MILCRALMTSIDEEGAELAEGISFSEFRISHTRIGNTHIFIALFYATGTKRARLFLHIRRTSFQYSTRAFLDESSYAKRRNIVNLSCSDGDG